MLAAIALAFTDLADRRVAGLLARSVAITLAVFAVLGVAGWYGLAALLAYLGVEQGAGAFGALLALGLTVVLGWLLFRLVAIAVLQFFADEIVSAIETRHYPAAAGAAQPLGWRGEARQAMAGLGRAALYNAIALPFALALLVTGIGTVLLFGVVNAVLVGRELDDMVRLRHRDAAGRPLPPQPRLVRFAAGGAVVVLLATPVINLLAPLFGAALATHLVHRAPARTGRLADAG